MTNFEKMKHLVQQLQFFIDEGLINEENCGMVKEEIFSTMEVLSDCDAECQKAFKEDMEELKLKRIGLNELLQILYFNDAQDRVTINNGFKIVYSGEIWKAQETSFGNYQVTSVNKNERGFRVGVKEIK